MRKLWPNFEAKSLHILGGTEERLDRKDGRVYCARMFTEDI
jgi:hypothetical protein